MDQDRGLLVAGARVRLVDDRAGSVHRAAVLLIRLALNELCSAKKLLQERQQPPPSALPQLVVQAVGIKPYSQRALVLRCVEGSQ